MRYMVVTPTYPAAIMRHGDLSQQKLVLISPVPAPVQAQPQYIIFEVGNPAGNAEEWLGTTYYMIKRSTLVVPFFAPDRKLVLQQWNCFFTIRPMGKVLWNTEDRRMKLIFGFAGHHFRTSAAYFCLGERLINLTKPLDLHRDDEMAPNEHSSIRAHFADVVEDEPTHREMPKLQTGTVEDEIPTRTSQRSMATPRHDLAHLLPSDPFGMGSSDSTC